MKRISYADDFIITHDDIADAVLNYASQLARAERSDVIHIPALDHDGRLTSAMLVLGPASQLLAVPEEHTPVEMDVVAALDDLQGRMDELASPRNVPLDGGPPDLDYPDEI